MQGVKLLINNEKRKFKDDLRIITRGYKTLHSIDKSFIGITAIRELAGNILPFVNLYMAALIITAISKSEDIQLLIMYALVAVSINLIVKIIQNLISKKYDIRTNLMQNRLDAFYNEVNVNMQYEHLENSDVHVHRQRIEQTQNNSQGGIMKLVWATSDFIGNIFSLVFSISLTASMFIMQANGDFTGVFAFVNSPVSIIVIIFVIIVNTAVNVSCEKSESHKRFELNKIWSDLNHSYWYFAELIQGEYAYAMDIRLFRQKSIIKAENERYIQNEYRNQLIANKIPYKFAQIREILNAFMNIVLYLYVGVKAYIGTFEIGGLIMYTGAIWRFVSSFSNLLELYPSLINNNVYLQDIFNYVDLPNNMYKGSLSIEKNDNNDYEIEFRNVSFKYPSSEQYSLKNVSFKFKIGERLAVVGMNGSGKTTMIKLLCRLYDPTEGEIRLNGFDIKKYDYKEYMDLFSVVFQDFKLFSFPLGQNVASAVGYNTEKAIQCLKMAGFGDRFSSMTKGLETALYKDFEEDGVEISGGEAQKIALARALYKDTPFIVLDEPTAALDPIAEFEVYSKFNEIVGDKTAIYISHRLSSCRFCDDIAVFHEGEFIQRGSHDVLIKDESGKYYELWNAQAQYYAKNQENTSVNI